MSGFDYSMPAQLFRRKTRKGPTLYLRFDTAAAAIGYAVEGLADSQLVLTTIEVDEERLDGSAIRDLYDADAYPLVRKDPTAI